MIRDKLDFNNLFNRTPPTIEVFSGEQNGVEWVVTIELDSSYTFIKEALFITEPDGETTVVTIQNATFNEKGIEVPF